MIAALQSKDYDFLVVNFANGDMVGHTAIREAILEAVAVLDLKKWHELLRVAHRVLVIQSF